MEKFTKIKNMEMEFITKSKSKKYTKEISKKANSTEREVL